jgi:hypothetical protein
MLTELEKAVVSQAWGLALRGQQFVPTDAYVEVCRSLHERGWLAEARNERGDDAYALSDEANIALHRSGEGRWN